MIEKIIFILTIFLLIKPTNCTKIIDSFKYCHIDDSLPELNINIKCDDFEALTDSHQQEVMLLEKKNNVLEGYANACKVTEVRITTYKNFFRSTSIIKQEEIS